MKRVRAAATKQFEAPEVPELMPSYDPFNVAKQFDQLRSSFTGGGASPFNMPTIQPKPIDYGGQLAGGPAPDLMSAPGRRAAPATLVPKVAKRGAIKRLGTQGLSAVAQGHYPGDGHNHAPGPVNPTAQQKSDWGSKTQTFQKAFPTLRHTSGYRSPEHNARTPGAAKNSYHMQKDGAGNARANDYVGSARDMAAAGAWAKQNGAKEVLVHNAGTGQHLHIAW